MEGIFWWVNTHRDLCMTGMAIMTFSCQCIISNMLQYIYSRFVQVGKEGILILVRAVGVYEPHNTVVSIYERTLLWRWWRWLWWGMEALEFCCCWKRMGRRGRLTDNIKMNIMSNLRRRRDLTFIHARVSMLRILDHQGVIFCIGYMKCAETLVRRVCISSYCQ